MTTETRSIFAWFFHNKDGRVLFVETLEVKERLEAQGTKVTPLFTIEMRDKEGEAS